MTLDATHQGDWSEIFDLSAYTIEGACSKLGLDRSSFSKYLSCDRLPRKTNLDKMVAFMKTLLEGNDRIKFHPSYGYATEEQIKQLNTIGFGPTRDALLRQIEKQTKFKGKYK